MSDLGDIGDIINAKPLADLDWLEVDEEEYRALDTLPEPEHNSIPELEAQWGDFSEGDQYNLSPVNQDLHTSSFSAEPLTAKDASEKAATIEIVEKFSKRHLQAGVKGKDLIKILKRNFDSDVLAISKEAVRNVLTERGLLGSVYVDSSLSEDCYKGGVVKGLTANTKKAKYVLAKNKCSGCIHNLEGRCSVFQKELVFDVVDYTQDLWEEYEDRLQIEGKDLQPFANLPIKARLQKAILAAPKPSQKPLDGKPVMPDPTAGVTYEEAVAKLRSSNIKQEIVADVRKQHKVCRIAQEMMRGNHGPNVQELVEMDPVLASLKSESYLLGNLYLDLSYFPTYKVASEFMSDLGTVPPIVVGIPFEEVELDNRFAQAAQFDIRSDTALTHVVSRYFVSKFGHEMTAKKKKQFERLFARLQKTSDTKVRRFAQGVYKNPLPHKARQYAAQVIYDPTKGITSKEADQRLQEVNKHERMVVQNPSEVAYRKSMVARMLRGDHSSRVASFVAEDSDLAEHLHLLGRLYVSTSLASPKEIEAATASNPELSDLPLLTPNNQGQFFSNPEVHFRIAQKVAAVKGYVGSDRNETIRDVISALSGSGSDEVRAFAKKVFALPDKYTESVYSGSVKPADKIKKALPSVRASEATSMTCLRSVFSSPVGEDFLRVLAAKIGLDRLRRVYLSGEGKVATNLRASNTAKEDAREILSAVLSGNYKPSGIMAPTAEMLRTKMGRFLRDRLLEGSRGQKLASELKDEFSYAQLLEYAPVIIAFRESEGHYGEAYITADSFDDCSEGTRKVGSSVKEIVRASKCSGCVYDKTDRCLLYARNLVKARSSKQKTANTKVALDSISLSPDIAASGDELMVDFDMAPIAQDGDLAEIDFHGKRKPAMDINFGGGLILE